MKNKFNKINFKYKADKNFISVVIPVYKDPKGIKDTLDSLKNQTLDKKNFEIIIANDGGDKQTEKICKKYDVKVVTLNPNRGSYAARDRALEESKGEHIAFIDADMTVEPNWLKTGLNWLNKCDYIGGKVLINNKNLKTLAHYFEYISAFDFKRKVGIYHYAGAGNLFVKRDLIEKMGGFDKRLSSGGDVEFGNRIFNTNKYKICYADNVIAIHPPKDKYSLIKKYIRVKMGTIYLFKFFPDKFPHFRTNKFEFIKTLIFPFYKVISAKKKIPLIIKLKLLPWSLYLGIINLFNLFKIIKNNK
jgi:glycosyltransferase AglI